MSYRVKFEAAMRVAEVDKAEISRLRGVEIERDAAVKANEMMGNEISRLREENARMLGLLARCKRNIEYHDMYHDEEDAALLKEIAALSEKPDAR